MATKTKAKKTTAKRRPSKAKVTTTAIHILLDRSGSMGGARESTCKGFNDFLQEQRGVENAEAALALTQFDTEYEPNRPSNGSWELASEVTLSPLTEVPYLDYSSYEPRSGTALYDAIAKSMGDFSAAIKGRKFDQVIFVIMTDGLENASKEFNRFQDGKKRIFDLIKQKTDTDKWQFVYLGANQDAYQESSSIGLRAGVTSGYSGNAVGTRDAWETLSSATKRFRGSGQAVLAANANYFSDEEREKLEGR